MKTDITKLTETNETRVAVTFNAADFELMQHRILDAAVGAASECIANLIVKEQGPRMIASIPFETILNRVVAEAVVKIGKAGEAAR